MTTNHKISELVEIMKEISIFGFIKKIERSPYYSDENFYAYLIEDAKRTIINKITDQLISKIGVHDHITEATVELEAYILSWNELYELLTTAYAIGVTVGRSTHSLYEG